jgi:ABC-type transporter Mla maintaining outer membrane lipid asymmetry ATPase subunit MlaF
VSKIVSPNAPVALKVENLRKSFGTNEVLKGISLEAREGEVIAILGSSGSGKSTFLRCINLLETPTSGTVTVSGETIRMAKNSKGEAYPTDKKQVSRIRSELGMVFQSFNLWSHKTILEGTSARGMRGGSRGPAGEGWHRRQARFLSGSSFWRTAAARCDCPRTGNEAEGHAL